MERLRFESNGGSPANAPRKAALVGVVGSGNLEILIESADLHGGCVVEVETAAVGFGQIWEAVIGDFFARHHLSDARLSINDAGATPAVVALRLDQAVEAWKEARP